MSAKSIRIVKEARSLFWPWCVVVFAGALRLVNPSHPELHGRGLSSALHNFIEPVSFLGFFLGLPLLATLSLGNEFQHRTLALMLSQPVRRMEIWSEKFSVTIIAVVSAALVFGSTWRSSLREDPELWIGATALLLIMTASAPFWTLVARSTMGGLALNFVNSLIPLIMSARRDWIPQTVVTRSFAVFALLCYAGAMLWLGRQALTRFQVTGGIAGDDLLMAGPDVLPRTIVEWFRSRPAGLTLNLIRKEFRLLRPVWLLSLLGLMAWFCLPAFRYTPGRASPAMLMIVAFTPLIAVLGGTLSLGEERSSGTHSWHLTLPVSAARLWLIKLAMALFTSLICAVLLPGLAVRAGMFIFRSPLPFDLADLDMVWVFGVLILTFVSFWCATAANGTVRAALCVFPIIIGIALASSLGAWLAPGTVAFLVSKLNFFSNFRFTNSLANFKLSSVNSNPLFDLLLLLVPTLLLALIQSYRLFRRQLQDSALPMIRNFLQLAVVLCLCTFSIMGFFSFAFEARESMWAMFKETNEAIAKSQPGLANFDAAHPLRLTAEDLAKSAPLSTRTQRWLRESRIIVVPRKPFPPCCGVATSPDKAYRWYSVSIHLPSGTVCASYFLVEQKFGFGGGNCK